MSFKFHIQESEKLKGVYFFKPDISVDLRGNIWTTFNKKLVEKYLPKNLEFVHDKFSTSNKDVLRGIHGDNKSWKLVTCVYGNVQQVVVDLRKDSDTYKQFESIDICWDSPQLILIPPNMGNAFLVKSDVAVYHYKLAYHGKYIDAADQFSFPWNDKEFSINWDCDLPILSERDKNENYRA